MAAVPCNMILKVRKNMPQNSTCPSPAHHYPGCICQHVDIFKSAVTGLALQIFNRNTHRNQQQCQQYAGTAPSVHLAKPQHEQAISQSVPKLVRLPEGNRLGRMWRQRQIKNRGHPHQSQNQPRPAQLMHIRPWTHLATRDSFCNIGFMG